MRKRRLRKKYNYKRIIFLVLLIFIIIAAAAYAAWHFARSSEESDPSKLSYGATKEIMVIGVDPRDDDSGRSDTLMIISLNEENKKASVLSIPRDTRVKFEGGGYEKINHAYAYGGHELTRKMAENLIGTKIENYILVDIQAFIKLIDAIGGVDIEVEKRMYYEDPWDSDGGLIIDLYPGEQHLDGKGAMEYVRFRDEEGDIGRIRRQQKFLQAVLDRVTSSEVAVRIPSIVRETLPIIKTDISATAIGSMALEISDIKGNGVSSDMLPGRPGWWNGSSYWLPKIEESRRLLASKMEIEFTPEMEKAARDADIIYEVELPKNLVDIDGTLVSENAGDEWRAKNSTVKPEDISVNVLNMSGITGAAHEAADFLEGRGFKISNVGNGGSVSLEKTTLTIPDGSRQFFDNLPFSCVINEGGEIGKATLEIGLDYEK